MEKDCKRGLDYFKQKLKDKFPNEDLEVLSYTVITEPATVRCNNCGETYTLKGRNFFCKEKKRVCKKCLPLEDITIEVGHKIEYLLNNIDNLEVIVPYEKISVDMVFRCKNCGREFKRKPRVFLNTQKCPCCETHCRQNTKESYQAILEQRYGDEYSLVGEFKTSTTRTLFRHNDCGFIFENTPQNVYTKAPCPKCKKFNSKGELKIKKILDSHGIDYEQQKRFEEINSLSFDFYIPSKNLLIEFNGEQHYKPIKHFGGESKYQKQKENDSIKKQYCKTHNINLVIIPYTNIDKVEEILSFLWFND